jgi:hypothetical protein
VALTMNEPSIVGSGLVGSGVFAYEVVDGVIGSAMALDPVSNVFPDSIVEISVVVKRSAP